MYRSFLDFRGRRRTVLIESGAELSHFLKRCQKLRSHVDVVCGGMVLRPVVAKVSVPRPPKESELFLIDCPVAEPVEPHVHGF